jgi:hypothetical protein
MKAGKAKREDNEYSRNGTAVILLAYDIDLGFRRKSGRWEKSILKL